MCIWLLLCILALMLLSTQNHDDSYDAVLVYAVPVDGVKSRHFLHMQMSVAYLLVSQNESHLIINAKFTQGI